MSITQLMLLIGDLSAARDVYLTQHSLRFDGTADYLGWSNPSASNRTTNTFSFWFKPMENAGAFASFFQQRQATLGTQDLQFFIHMPVVSGRNSLQILGQESGTNDIFLDSGTDLNFEAGTWYHLVVAVDTTQGVSSDRVKVWIDGQLYTNWATGTYPSQNYITGLNRASTRMLISARRPNSSATLDRYSNIQLAEYHFIDGTAYDASYFGETRGGVWLPKEVTDVTYGNNGFYLDFAGNDTGVTLLLDGDGTNGQTTFTDKSSVQHTVTAYGNAQVDTSIKKFGTGSMKFDGSGDYIAVPDDPSLELGSGDFTFECWVYHNGALVNYVSPCGKLAADNVPDGFYFAAENSGKMRFLAGDGSNWQVGLVDTANFPYDQWVHLAATREGNKFTLWVNGVSRATTTTTSFSIGNNSTPFYVGVMTQTDVQSWHYWNGNVEDLRITKGVARYTNSFTPPTSALTNTPEYLGDFGVDRTTNSNDFTVPANTLTPDDQLIDSPNLRFATWDTVNSGSTAQFREGNLLIDHGTTDTAISTMGSSAKFYAEMYYKSGTYFMAEVRTAIGASSYAGYWSLDGNAYNTNTAYGDSFGTGSIIGVAADANTGTVWFSKNGVWQNGATASGIAAGTDTNYARTGLTGTLYLASSDGTGSDVGTEIIANFGQDHTFAGAKSALLTPYSDANGVGEFYYQPPSGFLALADNYVVTGSLETTGVLSVSEMLQASL